MYRRCGSGTALEAWARDSIGDMDWGQHSRYGSGTVQDRDSKEAWLRDSTGGMD